MAKKDLSLEVSDTDLEKQDVAFTDPLDDLDRQVIAGLVAGAKKAGVEFDLTKFVFGGRKDVCFFPGASYINWVISIKSIATGKHLRTDPFLWPRGDYYLILEEIKALSK